MTTKKLYRFLVVELYVKKHILLKQLKINALELKEIRKTLGLSQGQLAQEMGVSISTIAGYEQGNNIPDRVVIVISHILQTRGLSSPNVSVKETEEIDHLKEKIIYLERMLEKQEAITAEKERTIQLLLSK